MDMTNYFKRALRGSQTQIGLWTGNADPYVTEIFAAVGYDWLVIDGEHGPNDLRSILGQLQSMAAYTTAPVVRPVKGDAATIKQLLDIGAQNLLIPMVESAAQAAALVAATRYPPEGIRGVGSALARASHWKLTPDYLKRANDEVCLLVQAESVAAIENIEAIAATEGVDGVFFGPADLGASMGYLHDPANPAVQEAVLNGMQQVLSCGKAAGILTTNKEFARRCIDIGAQFVAVGVDTLLMTQSAKKLLADYK